MVGVPKADSTKVDAVVSRSESVLPGLCVNVNAGFHVHVDISDVGLDDIKRICAGMVFVPNS